MTVQVALVQGPTYLKNTGVGCARFEDIVHPTNAVIRSLECRAVG